MAATLDEMREAADEVALARRAGAGDRAAFDALARAHFTRVYTFLHRMIGSHEDAEDLAQECFVRAWRALPHYRAEAAFPTWVCRIALHLAQDHHRTRARRAELVALEEVESPRRSAAAAGPSAPEASPMEALSRGEVARSLTRAIQGLPPRLRAALVLRAIEGREYTEVAAITGVTPATARTHVMQARRILQRRLASLLEEGAR